MKFLKSGLLGALSLFVVITAGCSTSKPPKEEMASALVKLQEAKSLKFTGDFAFDDVVIPQDKIGDEESLAATNMIVQLLKGATIKIHGAMQKEPQRSELVMDLSFGSEGMKVNLTIPIIITKDKVWLKVPQIPGFALPDTIAGKFIEVDLNKLKEEQKNGAGAALLNTEQTEKLSQDILKTVLDNFDDKTYFSEPKAEDVKGLPEGYKGDKFVRFSINQQNVDQTITTVIDKVAPQIIDLLLKNEEYLKALQLKKEDLEAAKKDLADKKEGETQKTVDELKKNLKINELSFTGGIEDDYMTYQDMRVNLDSTDPKNLMKLAVHFTMSYDDINDKVKFEYELPKDAVPVEQLQDMLTLPSGL
ncbi:hypothetical protein ACFPYJ_02485 [Paenibacillus solisilvae]|uniref:Lipoprotein n=1 Tax=Paenibacillus solisilvae TaxID=2486751 RepID=A0ABW0VVA3_9BACL